jgi:hypothetical protein
MRVLFDNGAPARSCRLTHRPHRGRSRFHAWEKLENGKLIEAAEREGFQVIVTTDKNIRYREN